MRPAVRKEYSGHFRSLLEAVQHYIFAAVLLSLAPDVLDVERTRSMFFTFSIFYLSTSIPARAGLPGYSSTSVTQAYQGPVKSSHEIKDDP